MTVSHGLVTDSTGFADNMCHIGVRWVSLWCLSIIIISSELWFILILIRPVLDRENHRIPEVIYLSISNVNRRPRPRDEFLYFFTFYACTFLSTSVYTETCTVYYCVFVCPNHTIHNLDQKLILRFDRVGFGCS